MKKNYKKLIVFLGLFLLMIVTAACGNSDNNNAEDEKDGERKIEILSWWTAGGEADALNTVLDGFHDEYPDIIVENAAVAGGGGSNSQAVLSSRLQGGDPPAIFQAQGGKDLLRWLDAGYLQDMDGIFAENNWDEVFPSEIIDMNKQDEHVYGLPMNIHKNNVIWYDKKLFDELNLKAPETFDELIEVSEKLKDEGVTPIALGDKNPRWTTLWFDVLLLEELGADKYAQLWNGEIDFDSKEVVNAAEKLKTILGYINDNHSALDWQDAGDLIIDGEAAMQLMGDWESGYFETKGWEPNEDYGWVAAPGTQEYFNVVNDSMGFPEGVKDEESAKKLISYMGSKEAQEDFNKLKGSIPARTDVDTSDFSVYSQDAAEDFKNLKITISLAGGSATPAGFLSKVDDAINAFVTQQDVDNFINTLVDAQSLLSE
ncbi:ABC transporter substrate-binding protein [Oceanobacillus neutriphilus]|uniref:Probable sugar-binding periplasmic protein n=1 Tax=Oceanobacillus neutriphilus TaxID=531815 RepID=A0ABQ2NW83_9BACI|nr:extracellular solute-binding protein [Oceanobacillus neutriphilus]GGP12076.1 ABC transporter substrate-binding protein [Oceanobacillus neutriphilus]